MNAKSFGAITITLVVTAAFIASMTVHFQRETTSIEEKYSDRSSEETDQLYHTSYLQVPGDDFALTITEDDTYSDNIKDKAVQALNNLLHAGPVNDWDDDGLTNNEEESIGTQPDNPDTDGDGIIDSQDPAPLDPTIGGAIVPPPETIIDVGDISITNFYKAACNPNLPSNTCDKDNNEDWQIDQIDGNINQGLEFKIHIELENTSNVRAYINLFDLLPKELLYFYYPGSAEIQINSGPLQELNDHQDNWLEGLYPPPLQLTVASKQRKIYNIWFNATFLQRPAINTVELWFNNKMLVADSITIK